MKSYYDFKEAKKPEYAKKFREGGVITIKKTGTRRKTIEEKMVVLIEPDVSKVFRNSTEVNNALRHLIAAFPKK